MIASLAVLFAAPALAPAGQLDAAALLILLGSLGLLLVRGWGVLPLIGSAALLGLLRSLLQTLLPGSV